MKLTHWYLEAVQIDYHVLQYTFLTPTGVPQLEQKWCLSLHIGMHMQQNPTKTGINNTVHKIAPPPHWWSTLVIPGVLQLGHVIFVGTIEKLASLGRMLCSIDWSTMITKVKKSCTSVVIVLAHERGWGVLVLKWGIAHVFQTALDISKRLLFRLSDVVNNEYRIGEWI